MKKTFFILAVFLLIIASGFSFYHSSAVEATSFKTKLEYKGMNLVAPIKELKNTTFDELKAHHINSISLIPYAFVDVENASVHYNNKRQWWGERTEGIRASNQLAHEYKMTVMLKPHLWVNHNFYTGNLDFSTDAEWKKWEANYEKYILDFAQLAQQENIELFCFGTELGNSVAKRPEYWLQLIHKIKKLYTGKLTYAANWDDFDKVPFWDELDYIGIDAYFPLSDATTPAVADLNEAWQQHILKMEKLHTKTSKKILFTEFGYRNSDQAAKEPWKENQSGINNLAQANAYKSLFQTLTQKKWFAGGFAWKWYADAYHKEPKNSIDYTPQEKPALETIKKWYQ
ncbi:hypothetical protein SAMN05444395_10990 [Flavobacterium fryxellicola]|uniref:Glycoside hydrolase n=1 Tax=Flavobacterium fryxellicola TaxID=249352 RepID=A0A167U604_9FLAO|nr:hypothetical protein [Flavobacterium fryxellicola]OAB25287.1 hypothetical protein FBFR_14965 [Flavobacterium fryxellicola]SHN75398.1 hypothetical protein SAMN05444395_10990 [Flavobacterium fryxellicola]